MNFIERNTLYSKHCLKIKKELKTIEDRVLFIVGSPFDLYGLSFSKETLVSIVDRRLQLLGSIQECYYRKKDPVYDWYSTIQCWKGIKAYLEGSRDWDICMGVNNPFLMGNSFII